MIDHTQIGTANRKYQRWVVDTALKNWQTDDKQFVVLNSPTGTGKSIIGMVLQYLQSAGYTVADGYESVSRVKPPAKVMTTTKALQRQYISDFDIHHLYGATNYECYNGKAKHYKASGCLKRHCPDRDRCEYLVQRSIAATTTSVINYAQAFSLPEITESAEVLVFDESHDFATTVLDVLSTEMTEKLCFEAKIVPPKWDDLDAVKAAAAKLGKYAATLGESDEDLAQELNSCWAASLSEELVYIPNEKSATFKPPFLTREMLDPLFHGKKVLFMTATLGSYNQFLTDAGISREEAAYIDVPPVFDPEKTPHVWRHSVGRLNASNLDEKIPDLRLALEKILCEHEGQRGLIHVPSYALANDIMESNWVYQCQKNRVRICNSNNYEEMMAEGDDIVLMSPSLHTGVSFDGDDARFNVITKASWGYLGDPWISFRKNHSDSWYVNEAVKKLRQQIGRTTRSPDDWSTIYFLDEACRSLLK